MDRIESVSVVREFQKTVNFNSMQFFEQTPRKTGDDKPLVRLGAFELFNLFTASIIQSKEVFTR